MKRTLAICFALCVALSAHATCTGGSATLPQSDNFDSDSTGIIAPGWCNVSGAWQVGTVHPISSPNTFSDTAIADGDVTLYQNMVATADAQQYDEQVLASDGFLVGSLLRMDISYANGYTIVFEFTSSTNLEIIFFKRISGSYTSIGLVNFTLTETVGSTYAVRTLIQGTTISAKVWLKSAGEPGAWSATETDGSVSAAGYVGLYNSGGAAKSIDNWTVAVPGVFIQPNNAGIVYSPGNWDVTSSRAFSINAGAYFWTLFPGPSVTLNFNTANLGSPPSQLYYRIDGYETQSPWTEAAVASAITPAMPSNTAAYPYHLLEVLVKSTSQSINRWNSSSATAVQFAGMTITSGTPVAPVTSPGGSILVFGDSIAEGVRSVNQTAANDTDQNDALQGWAYALREKLGVEVGVIGFGAQGWTVAGSGNVPALPSSYNLIAAGISRTCPTNTNLIVIEEGTNDGSSSGATVTADVAASLNGLEAMCPGIPIAVLEPFPGTQWTAIQAGISACTQPALVHAVSTTGFFNTSLGSSDGLHPTGPNDLSRIAGEIAAQLSPLIYPKGKSYTYF